MSTPDTRAETPNPTFRERYLATRRELIAKAERGEFPAAEAAGCDVVATVTERNRRRMRNRA